LFGLVSHGFTDKQIAVELKISPPTVDGHLRRIFGKVGVTVSGSKSSGNSTVRVKRPAARSLRCTCSGARWRSPSFSPRRERIAHRGYLHGGSIEAGRERCYPKVVAVLIDVHQWIQPGRPARQERGSE
jgi:hypothetical protein